MKNKITFFTRLLPVLLILVIGTSGCNRKPRYGSVLPGRAAGVTDDSIAGRGNNPGGRTGIDNVPPITGGFNPGAGTNPTPIAVPESGFSTDSQSRADFDSMEKHPEKFETQTVYFEFDKWSVRASEIEKIKTVAAHLKANASHKLDVEGHCDERGSAEYNLGLGDRRSTSARDFLVQLGVPADRLRVVSYGKERPQCTESNESCWQKNRRAHFVGVE